MAYRHYNRVDEIGRLEPYTAHDRFAKPLGALARHTGSQPTCGECPLHTVGCARYVEHGQIMGFASGLTHVVQEHGDD
jgi:hypothetical protein